MSNFDFIHNPRILHCLKDQLLASGPILHGSVGQDDHGGCGETSLYHDFFF